MIFMKGVIIAILAGLVITIAVMIATAGNQPDPGIRVKVAPDGAVCHYYEARDGSIEGFDCESKPR